MFETEMRLRVAKDGSTMRDVDRSMILKVRDMIAGVVHSIPCATITFGAKVPSSIIVLSGNVGIFWWFINPVGDL